MLKISSSERKYIIEGTENNLRSDGRSRLDFRPFMVETGVIVTTNGSARVKLDTTDVLVGIKIDVGEPLPEEPNKGRIDFSVDCCPSINPIFEGRGADELNAELLRILLNTYKNAFNFESLCLVAGKYCWVIYIDVLVTKNFLFF